MTLAVFPTLPGLSWSVMKSPQWATRVAQHVSGREVRAAFQAYPLWNFELTYEILRAGSAYQELQTLTGFYLAQQGQFAGFLYADPSDQYATGQGLGVGDGATVSFPFVRSLGGFVEPVWALGACSQVTVAGAPVTGWSLTAGPVAGNSVLTFATPPAAGAAIAASFSFYYYVRFAEDSLGFENFLYQLWSLKTCKLRSLKP